MKHVKIVAFDVPDAWFKALKEIWVNGEVFVVGRGSECTETKKLNLTIEIEHPENRPLVCNEMPNDMKFINWYFPHDLWFEKDPENTAAYTYGDLLRKPIDQIQGVIDKYVEQFNDRQNTMVLRRPEHLKRGFEPPCLTMIDTEILDKVMHQTSYFRSWDAYAGLPANIAALQLFNEQMVSEINEKVTEDRHLTTGKLILHSKNCHIYERQYKFVESLFNKKCEKQVIKNETE